MSDPLPPVLAREVDRWARELAASRGGMLLLAVGRSVRRREAVEAGLAARMPGWSVRAVTLTSGATDPWASALTVESDDASRTVISLNGLMDCEDGDRTLAVLNLGREHLGVGAPALVLWVGLEDIDRVRRKAPDLWSYRRRVGFFLASEDFDRLQVTVASGHSLAEKIAGYLEQFADLDANDPGRTYHLARLAKPYLERGEYAAAFSTLDQIRTSAQGSLREFMLLQPNIWRMVNCARNGAATEIPAGITSPFATANHHRRGQYREAHFLRGEVRSSILSFEDRVLMWLALGNLRRAEEVCPGIGYRSHFGGFIETDARAMDCRASIARHRLDSYRALAFEHHAMRLANANAAIGPSAEIAVLVIADHRELGLIDEAERQSTLALGREIPRPELVTALQLELARVQACQDVSQARSTCESAIAQLERTLAENPPGWTHATLRLALADVLDLLAELTPEHAESLRRDALATLARDEQDATTQGQSDLAQQARSRQIELFRELGDTLSALAIAQTALDWSTRNEGPSRIAECQLAFARIHRTTGDLARAAEHLDAAERALTSDDPLYQPRATWKHLLIERHQLALAQADPLAALAALDQAIARMRDAGLRKFELELLHIVAELPAHPDLDTRRLEAARETLELARDASLVYEEARALANLALIEAERGRDQVARKHLDEVLFLAEHCHLQPLRARLDLAVTQLAARERLA